MKSRGRAEQEKSRGRAEQEKSRGRAEQGLLTHGLKNSQKKATDTGG